MKTTAAQRSVLKELHQACKDERVSAPTDLPNSDEFVREFLLAFPDVIGDYLNAGEIPELEQLVPDLFDEKRADPAELVLVVKRSIRAHARSAMDREYESAKLGGLFVWGDLEDSGPSPDDAYDAKRQRELEQRT